MPLRPDRQRRRVPARSPIRHPKRLAPFLQAGRLAELFSKAGLSYHYVIVDGGPLLGAPEARILGEGANKVLLVVRWGVTRRETAQHGLQQLASDDANNPDTDKIYTVLTQVNLREHAKYRFGDMGEVLAGLANPGPRRAA